jgi:hypothetical protein
MNRQKCESFFCLAGFKVHRMWELPNQYWPRHPLAEDADEYEVKTYIRYARWADNSPWFLVKTEFGLIEIGDRKRVTQIEWSDTPYRGIITEDAVTKESTLVHAWDQAKVLEYLVTLRKNLEAAVGR